MRLYQPAVNFLLPALTCILLLLVPVTTSAHIKWFVEFDVSDPPLAIWTTLQLIYIPMFLVLAALGVVFATWADDFWMRHFGSFRFFRNKFTDINETSLNIMRIGTGVGSLIMWLMGGLILTPELYSDANFIPYLHIVISISVLFRSALNIAAAGLFTLYIFAVYKYGIFHLLDYVLILGQAAFLMLSVAPLYRRWGDLRFPALYLGLIFSFLWSAVEKIAYPEWFYKLLEEHSFLAMGLDWDFFILAAAFVEFTLFFLLLICHNGVILLALIINLLITSGNLYFGKVDAIGHFTANFMLVVLLLKGPLPVKALLFNQTNKSILDPAKSVASYLFVFGLMTSLYYGVHYAAYGN